MEKDLYSSILNRLQAQCARREYCIQDIRKKAEKSLSAAVSAGEVMSGKDGIAGVVESILESLVSEGFIDEKRYAAAYVREKSVLSGWGRRKIIYMLSSKGIDKQVIEQAFANVDEGKAGRKLRAVLLQKCRSLENDPQRRVKLIRYALSRGYGYDEVYQMVDNILSEERD